VSGRVLALLLLGSLAVAAQPGEVSSPVLKGHEARAPIDITANIAEVRQLEQMALFEGQVTAVQGPLTLRAEALRVSYDMTEADRPDVSRVEVRGNVRITSPDEQAQSDWGIYDVRAGTLTLGGDVIFRQNDTVIRADRLSLDFDTGLWQFDSGPATGGVSGSFAIPDRN